MEAINIYPELIKWKPNKQGFVPIAIRFDFKWKRVAYEQISYRIRPNDWNASERKVKSSYAEHALLNLLIENTLNKHRNYFLKRQAFNLPVSKELIKQYVNSGNCLESFYDYAEQILETKKLKGDGMGYSEASKRCYREEIKRLMQYKPTLAFSEVTVRFLEDYKLWMQNTYLKKDKSRLDKNSIWKTFKFMRMVYNEAIRNDLVIQEGNPFKKFEVGTYQINVKKIKYLELKDLDKIEHVLINNKTPEKLTISIGWRFLAMCVTGLRISDGLALDNLCFNDAGNLEVTPHKTKRYGNNAQIPIVSDRQRRYIEQAIAFPVPPTVVDSFRPTFNNHLKILAATAGTPMLTSHSGRHTMGSLIVDAGIEEKAAMAMLGIKSNKVIKTYMHLKESKLRSEAEKLKQIL